LQYQHANPSILLLLFLLVVVVVLLLQLPAVVKVISLSLNRQGTLLLVNCSDKVGRLYEVKPRPLGLQPLSIDQLKAALQCVEVGPWAGTGLRRLCLCCLLFTCNNRISP
jgi:competence protein ComGC